MTPGRRYQERVRAAAVAVGDQRDHGPVGLAADDEFGGFGELVDRGAGRHSGRSAGSTRTAVAAARRRRPAPHASPSLSPSVSCRNDAAPMARGRFEEVAVHRDDHDAGEPPGARRRRDGSAQHRRG